ncbi:MAG: AmmeMemoRadiSam system protein B, partial [Candidatus Omnitrophica bacterium]|nr:AmmeMemoRadiSam system protein B [Candidatus Omnitrophota bacterium]
MFGGKRVTLVTLCFCCFIARLYASDVKEPCAAGAFYPDNPRQIANLVDKYLNEVKPEPVEGEIFALISPHAGYGYSGKVAAY